MKTKNALREIMSGLLLILGVQLGLAQAPTPTYEQLKSFGKPATGSYPKSGLIQGTDGALYGMTTYGGSSGNGTVFKLNPDGTGFTVLKNFDYYTTGGYLSGRLIEGMDGALYGTTSGGGSSDYGTVFKLKPDGTEFSVLKNFDFFTTGGYLVAGLMQGTDGALYGTAYQGGSSGYGTIFKLNPDGSGFIVLKNMGYYTTGGYPLGGLMQGTDGALYGTAYNGGSSDHGTVFKLNPDGTGFTVLKNLEFYTTGGFPYAGLMQGADGALYGTAYQGGNSGHGTAFKLNPDGTDFTVLKNFESSTMGGFLFAGLMQGADGAVYGAAYQGGSSGYGTVFKFNRDGGGFAVLQNFDSSTTGGHPEKAELIQGTDGMLYGTATSGGSTSGGTVFKLNPDGTGFTVLKNLSRDPDINEGGYPAAALTKGRDGALYGTTSEGGSNGHGTVFKHNPDGSAFTVILNFDSSTTGAYPVAAVMQGMDGMLYGTAYYGGSSGYGTIFKLNPDGSGFTVLRNFDSSTTGGHPYARLMQGPDGILYGTATSGGSSGYGTVFKLGPDGTGFTILKNFDYSTTGGPPYSGLIQGVDGNLYGTAYQGGSRGYGTAFKLNSDGADFIVLRKFDFSTGAHPQAGLIHGMDGALYGTTQGGGSGGGGTVFKMNVDGTDFTVLQNFDYYTTGGYPRDGLIQGADGVLYGVTTYGGSSDYGTVFKLDADGNDFIVCLNFDYYTTGGYPFAGLVQGTDGNLYGTTFSGGDAGAGTVFGLFFNTPPVAKCKNVTVSAGAGCTAVASIDDGSSDPDAGNTITLTQTPAGPYPLGDTTVMLRVTDSRGVFSECTATVTVLNPNPVVTLTGPASGALYAINTPVNFTATFTDAGFGTHTGTWLFDDISQAATIVEPSGATPGSANATYTFTAPGVYTVKLTVEDSCGGSGTAEQIGGIDLLVVVYDPSAGFVTGGGWIDSPAGAYVPDPALTGKANFGFVSKYQKGANVPTGNTEFQFKTGNLNFSSTVYQWLVVAGAKAQYKGEGTINGSGNYGFLLTATDGQINGGGGIDQFRIKIWDRVTGDKAYDNVPGDVSDDIDAANPQAIGGGSIVIHKPK